MFVCVVLLCDVPIHSRLLCWLDHAGQLGGVSQYLYAGHVIMVTRERTAARQAWPEHAASTADHIFATPRGVNVLTAGVLKAQPFLHGKCGYSAKGADGVCVSTGVGGTAGVTEAQTICAGNVTKAQRSADGLRVSMVGGA